MSGVSILCAQPGGVYAGLADVWDRARDAWNYRGRDPVVAHPPCRLWGRLSHLAKAEDEETERALGIWCARQVQTWGGVLEHPAYSRLWAAANLPKPGEFGRRGWTMAVPQYWFGHRGLKATWLYIVGVEPAEVLVPFRLVGPDVVPVEDMCRQERERTPAEMATWLVELARRARP